MNRLQLYRELRRHVSLSEKRSPVMEQNRTAKIIIYIMSGFMAVYLMFLGIMLARSAVGECTSLLSRSWIYSSRAFWHQTRAQFMK